MVNQFNLSAPFLYLATLGDSGQGQPGYGSSYGNRVASTVDSGQGFESFR